MTVWVTETGGTEEQTRIVGVSGGFVTTTAGTDVRRVPVSDILRVRARRSDSLVNGALIGAGAAVASGLFLCRLTEPWEICRNNVAPMFRIGAVGAAAGIAVDALIRGRQTIYEAPQRSPRVYAAPIVAGHARGVQVSVSF